jgi:DNA-binding CsgD family transcriptional regulator
MAAARRSATFDGDQGGAKKQPENSTDNNAPPHRSVVRQVRGEAKVAANPLSALSTIALELHRACRKEAVDAFQRWALERLRTQVPFDAALWASGAFDEAGRPVVHNMVLVDRPPELMADYELVKYDDLLARRNVANQGVALFENSIAQNPAWSREVVAYLAKWRIAHALSCITVDPLTRLSTAIALWRDPGSPPYREDERELFEALMPHFIETYAACRIARLDRPVSQPPGTPFVDAIADELEHLQVAPPDFLRLLRAEWPEWHGPRLPEPIRHLVRRGAAVRYVGRRIALRATRMNDVFLLQARERHSADALSDRELEVARLCATGSTYKEIAQRLDISPATVRNHLSSVFAKLQIGKQSELATALRVLD